MKNKLSEQYNSMLSQKSVGGTVNNILFEKSVKSDLDKITKSLNEPLIKLCAEIAKTAEERVQSLRELEVVKSNEEIIEEEVKRRLEGLELSQTGYDILFTIDEARRMKEFQTNTASYSGAIGGQHSLEVIFTSLGTSIVMKDSLSGESITVREIE